MDKCNFAVLIPNFPIFFFNTLSINHPRIQPLANFYFIQLKISKYASQPLGTGNIIIELSSPLPTHTHTTPSERSLKDFIKKLITFNSVLYPQLILLCWTSNNNWRLITKVFRKKKKKIKIISQPSASRTNTRPRHYPLVMTELVGQPTAVA